MTRPWLWLVIVANLIGLIALAFVFPAAMVSPGALEPAHAKLADNCLACHAPFRGAATDRCVSCHALADIGARTTSGAPLEGRTRPAASVSFHQQLTAQRCDSCHSEHGRRTERRFSHALLLPATRADCVICHAAPTNAVHRDLRVKCNQCHTTEHWAPATFDHASLASAARARCESCHEAPTNAVHRDLRVSCDKCHTTEHWAPASFDHASLPSATLARCESCHRAPADSYHRQITTACAQCHSPQRWKPSTFDHDKSFALDGDHNTSCATCHTDDDFTRYTCFGCHEHTPANIRAKHEEEGIGDLDDCVKCHRSADGEGGEGGEGRKHGKEH